MPFPKCKTPSLKIVISSENGFIQIQNVVNPHKSYLEMYV